MATIGVQYEVSPLTKPPSLTVEGLELQGIAYIRVQWVDLTNLVRSRILPISYFHKLLQSARPGISVTKVVFGLVGLSVVDGFGCNGEYLYAFDLETLRLCPYAPGHASIMGFFQEKSASPGKELNSPLCPRTILSTVVDNIRKKAAIELLVGFETEFILLGSKSEDKTNHVWSAASSLYTGSIETVVLEEIAGALQASGIELQMYHAEAAPKQYEIVTGPLPPLQAADALIHTRETIYNIANKHGLRATLVPRLHKHSAGNGAHVHFSVHSIHTEEEVIVDGITLRASEASFIAGLLDHLPSLVLLTYPTSASYGRMQDGIWSGGTYACWGVEHRETSLRVCHHTSPKTRNFELKTIDGTSNPYLVLAGILGTGATGVESKQQLSQKPIQVGSGAALLSKEDREAHGISQRLPLNLQEARDQFRASTVLPHVLGEEFVASYLNVSDALNHLLESQEDLLVKMY